MPFDCVVCTARYLGLTRGLLRWRWTMITMIVLYFVNLLHPLLQEEMLASIERSAFILKFKGYIVRHINCALEKVIIIDEDSSFSGLCKSNVLKRFTLSLISSTSAFTSSQIILLLFNLVLFC